jgi:hypothetical protein
MKPNLKISLEKDGFRMEDTKKMLAFATYFIVQYELKVDTGTSWESQLVSWDPEPATWAHPFRKSMFIYTGATPIRVIIRPTKEKIPNRYATVYRDLGLKDPDLYLYPEFMDTVESRILWNLLNLPEDIYIRDEDFQDPEPAWGENTHARGLLFPPTNFWHNQNENGQDPEPEELMQPAAAWGKDTHDRGFLFPPTNFEEIRQEEYSPSNNKKLEAEKAEPAIETETQTSQSNEPDTEPNAY